MFIWIGKQKRSKHGATTAKICGRCNNYVRYNLVRQHRMVSFNFIPLFAIGNTWRHECPICAHGQELVGEEIETQKRAALLAAAHAYAIKGEGDTIIPVRPSLATVPPRSLATERRSQAETTENIAGGQKLRLKVVAVVVAALLAVAVVCVAIIAPKNAPASSSSSSPSMQAIVPSTTAQTALPRTPSRANARRSKRTQPRTETSSAAPSAASSALPHADGER